MTGGRLLGLDGLRGVAAIGVLLLHAHVSMLPSLHGYLAVDLFFMLSGFVIAKRYEPVLAPASGAPGMSAGSYMIGRLERLYPMLFLGSLTGLSLFALGFSDFKPAGRDELILAIVSQFLLLEFLSPRGFFVFNNVQWSIVSELIANAVHATALPRLGILALIGVIAVSALGLAVNASQCGTLATVCAAAPSGIGLSRAFFGFFAGVLLHRLEGRWASVIPQVSFPLLAIVLLVLLSMPFAFMSQGTGHGVYDLVCVVLIFPLIVMLGVKTNAGRIAAELGALSYPLYAIHGPALNVARKLDATEMEALIVMTALVLAAWLIGRRVDEPLNAWRRRRRAVRRNEKRLDPSTRAVAR